MCACVCSHAFLLFVICRFCQSVSDGKLDRMIDLFPSGGDSLPSVFLFRLNERAGVRVCACVTRQYDTDADIGVVGRIPG